MHDQFLLRYKDGTELFGTVSPNEKALDISLSILTYLSLNNETWRLKWSLV